VTRPTRGTSLPGTEVRPTVHLTPATLDDRVAFEAFTDVLADLLVAKVAPYGGTPLGVPPSPPDSVGVATGWGVRAHRPKPKPVAPPRAPVGLAVLGLKGPGRGRGSPNRGAPVAPRTPAQAGSGRHVSEGRRP
jgi:hypothetical protein